MYVELLHGEALVSRMALDIFLVASFCVYPIWPRNLMVDPVKPQNG